MLKAVKVTLAPMVKDSAFGDADSSIYGGGDDQQSQATVVADSTDPKGDAAQSYLSKQKKRR